MSRKIMLLALAAVSAAVLVLPAMASASIPLHLSPTPAGTIPTHGGTSVLSDSGGSTLHCTSVSGSATFEPGGTTGQMNLTFKGCIEKALGTSCKSTGGVAGSIATTSLPFHLVMLPNTEPGVLLTPNGTESPAFAHIECAGGFIKFTVGGNGLIGTIENQCGEATNKLKSDFNVPFHGVQEHDLLAGTSTTYKSGFAIDTTITATFAEETELECT